MRSFSFLVLLATAALALACGSTEDRIVEHRTRANDYYENEQWNEAKIEFLNLLQAAPQDAEAHYRMGQVLFRLREYAEGLGELREAVRLDPENTPWRLQLVQVLSTARSYTSAREHVDIVLSGEPENVAALLMRAGLNSVANDLDAVSADVDAALKIEPENLAALAMKAQVLVRSDDTAGGEEYWRKLLAVSPTSANHLALARLLASLDRQEEALAISREAIEAAEGEAEQVAAQMSLADLYLSIGDKASTLRVLETAREQSPDNPRIVLSLARQYFATGQPENAEALLLEHVDRQPDSAEPLLVLADYYQVSGQPERAMEAIDGALVVAPTLESAQLRRAEYLHGGPNADEARRAEAWEIVEGVVAGNPQSIQAHFTEGKFHLLEGRHQEAATILRRVIDDQPNANAHVLLAEAYIGMDQPDLARREFQRALQLDAQNSQARTSLARLYLQTGEIELAAQEARNVLTGRPRDARSRLILASALIQQERPEEALEALDPLGNGEDLVPTARLDLARLRRRAGDSDGSRAILTNLLDNAALRAGAQAGLIDGDLRDGLPDQAIARLEGWISEEPDRADLYLLRGRVRLGMVSDGELAQPTEAEADLKSALEKGLAGIQAHLLLASLYLRTGATDAAFQILQEAAEIAPLDPRVPFQLATIAEQLGRTDELKEAYESVLRLDQEQPVVKNNLAWLLASAEEPSEEDLDRAMQLAQSAGDDLPNNPSVADTLGWVMLRKNIPSVAITLFQEAITGLPEGDPLRGTVHYHLAQAYERAGETDRSIEALERALELDPQNTRARMSKAALHLQTGEIELAEREARSAVAARPEDARPRLILAGALIRQERPGEALGTLEPLGEGRDLSPGERLDLARLRRQAGDSSGGRRILGDLLEQPEIRSRAQAELINTDLGDDKEEEAIARLDGWIAEEPQQAELYLMRARVRLRPLSDDEPSDPSQAEADLNQAIDKGLPGTQAHLLLASFYLRTEATESALQPLLQARDIAPEDARVPYQLGTVYERLGRADEARKAYEAALALDQDQPVVKNNLAWLLASAEEPSERDLDRALQLVQSAGEALPNNPSVADTLGWVMLKKNRPSAAIPLFHDAIAALPEENPLRGTVRYHLAQAYESNGETDLAIDELTRALDEVPSFAEREATEEMLRKLRSS